MKLETEAEPERLTPSEVAMQLRCSPGKVRRLFHQGELEGFRVGYNIVIFSESVLRYIEKHLNTRPPPEKPAVVKALERIGVCGRPFKYM